jgi:hypothetical protein
LDQTNHLLALAMMYITIEATKCHKTHTEEHDLRCSNKNKNSAVADQMHTRAYTNP